MLHIHPFVCGNRSALDLNTVSQDPVYSIILVGCSTDKVVHALETDKAVLFRPTIGQQSSIEMLPPYISSAIWNSDKKFHPESEYGKNGSIKSVRNDWEKTGRISLPRWLQYQSKYTKLRQAGFLLLSLAVLHYVYFGALSPYKFNNSNGQDQAPTLHFSTPTGTHNSPPIGLFIDGNKTWHVYFQCQSCTLVQQCMFNPPIDTDCTSWGHATSSDLYTWSMQPIALQGDDCDIRGGSAVIDKNNTSGLFPNQTNGVVAVYTQRHPVTRTLEQAIAYSTDGGYTFTKYSKNPALRFPEGNQDFRDPKVIWHEPTQRWVMTVAKATTIGIYTSPNLIDWVAASDFTNQDLVDVGHGFEYPNLIPIPRLNSTGARTPNLPTVPGGTVKDFGDYILLTSSSKGSPLNGGSITRYFPGKFNGTHFEPINNRTDRFIDFGPDNYASQFFFGLPDGAPVVSLGLASNLRYDTTSSPPAGRGLGQTSMFTGPREGYLIHGPGEGDLSYFSRPVGLDALRGETLANFSAQQLPDRSVFYNGSEAVLVEARFMILCTTVFRTWTADFGCYRSQTISKRAIDQMSVHQVRPLLPFHNPAVRRWKVQAIMDRSILEVFLNDGVKAGTATISSEQPIDSIHFQSSKIPTWATLSVNVQRLRTEQSARRHS